MHAFYYSKHSNADVTLGKKSGPLEATLLGVFFTSVTSPWFTCGSLNLGSHCGIPLLLWAIRWDCT